MKKCKSYCIVLIGLVINVKLIMVFLGIVNLDVKYKFFFQFLQRVFYVDLQEEGGYVLLNIFFYGENDELEVRIGGII